MTLWQCVVSQAIQAAASTAARTTCACRPHSVDCSRVSASLRALCWLTTSTSSRLSSCRAQRSWSAATAAKRRSCGEACTPHANVRLGLGLNGHTDDHLQPGMLWRKRNDTAEQTIAGSRRAGPLRSRLLTSATRKRRHLRSWYRRFTSSSCNKLTAGYVPGLRMQPFKSPLQ